MELQIFIEKVMPYREKVLKYALSLTGNQDDAEDIVQETLLCMWKNRDNLERYKGKIDALLVRVAHNLFISETRKIHAKTVSLDGVEMDENPLDKQDTSSYVRSLISQLPPLQRITIQMKEIEGYENSEIAAITGCSETAVRKNLQRARNHLKELINKTL